MTNTAAQRPLPRSLDPLPGESLSGFLLRLAYRLGCSPLHAARLCGLTEKHQKISTGHLIALTDERAQKFSYRSRLTIPETRALTLRPFAGSYPALAKIDPASPQSTTAAIHNWAINLRRRFCPQCLEGDGSRIEEALGGTWHLLWHLPVVFACLKHHRLLESSCPKCEKPLKGSGAFGSGLLENTLVAGLHPSQCRNKNSSSDKREKPHVCAARLNEAPPTSGGSLTAEDLDELLSLQERLTQLIMEDGHSLTRPHSFRAFHFPDLVAVAQLINLSWPVGESLLPSNSLTAEVDAYAAPIARRAIAKRANLGNVDLFGVRRAPDDAAQCGGLILAAENLLGDMKLQPLRSRLQPFVREAYSRCRPLAAAILRDGDVSTTLSLAATRRMNTTRIRAKLHGSSLDFGFVADEVPPYLPIAWFQKHFVPFVDQIPHHESDVDQLLRRGASLQLAELATGTAWSTSATRIGLSEYIGRRTRQTLRSMLNQDELWAAFEGVVHEIARELADTEVRVNYANRRRLLGNWELPEADWHALQEGIPGLSVSESITQDVGTVLIWSKVAQAEASRHPFARTSRHAMGASGVTTLKAWDCQSDLPSDKPHYHLHQRIDLYARRLAMACDIGKPLQVATENLERLLDVQAEGDPSTLLQE